MYGLPVMIFKPRERHQYITIIIILFDVLDLPV
jgi:hypothetical protein